MNGSFFNGPVYKTALRNYGLTLEFQVVSLQGDTIDPSTYPDTDDQGNAYAPPGLKIHPPNSHFRTSNNLSFDLGGTAAGPYSDMVHYIPGVQTILTGHRGSPLDVKIASMVSGTTVRLSKTGSPSLILSPEYGDAAGPVHINLPLSMPLGTYYLDQIIDPDFGTLVLTGNYIIKIVVTQ
jgi:hypothetical protein